MGNVSVEAKKAEADRKAAEAKKNHETRERVPA